MDDMRGGREPEAEAPRPKSELLGASKWAIIIIALIVAFALGKVVPSYDSQPQNRGQDLSAYSRLAEKVQVSVKIDPARCPNTQHTLLSLPMVIDIVNGADTPIRYTEFKLKARQPDYSTGITLTPPNDRVSTDRIIRPNQRWAVCQSVGGFFPEIPFSQIRWTIYDLKFEFGHDEDHQG